MMIEIGVSDAFCFFFVKESCGQTQFARLAVLDAKIAL